MSIVGTHLTERPRILNWSDYTNDGWLSYWSRLVRRYLSRTSNRAVIRLTISHGNRRKLAWIIRNPYLSSDQFIYLFEEFGSNNLDRYLLLTNPNCSPEMLDRILYLTGSPIVRYAIANNSGAYEQTQVAAVLLGSKSPEESYAEAYTEATGRRQEAEGPSASSAYRHADFGDWFEEVLLPCLWAGMVVVSSVLVIAILLIRHFVLHSL